MFRLLRPVLSFSRNTYDVVLIIVIFILAARWSLPLLIGGIFGSLPDQLPPPSLPPVVESPPPGYLHLGEPIEGSSDVLGEKTSTRALSLSFSPARESFITGQAFAPRLESIFHQAIDEIRVDIRFDPDLLAITGVEFNPVLTTAGQKQPRPGILHLEAAVPLQYQSLFASRETIATLHVETLATGSASLILEPSSVGYSQGLPHHPAVQPAHYTIRQPSV